MQSKNNQADIQGQHLVRSTQDQVLALKAAFFTSPLPQLLNILFVPVGLYESV